VKAETLILTIGLLVAGYFIWQQDVAIREIRAAQSKELPAAKTASMEQQKVCADRRAQSER
jgi:hypothetical protein